MVAIQERQAMDSPIQLEAVLARSPTGFLIRYRPRPVWLGSPFFRAHHYRKIAGFADNSI